MRHKDGFIVMNFLLILRVSYQRKQIFCLFPNSLGVIYRRGIINSVSIHFSWTWNTTCFSLRFCTMFYTKFKFLFIYAHVGIPYAFKNQYSVPLYAIIYFTLSILMNIWLVYKQHCSEYVYRSLDIYMNIFGRQNLEISI